MQTRLLQQTYTNNLTLEIISLDDSDFIYELVNTQGWIRFIGDRNVNSKEDATAYIEKILNTENLTYWVVRLSEIRTPIGIVTFLKKNYLDHFDIGFAFLPQFTGYGYAIEATTAILRKLKQDPKHQTVLATTVPSNENSIKLLTKMGFKFTKEISVENKVLHIYSY